MNNKKWDKRFMEVAQLVSTWSKDRSKQVGCVIVSEVGNILSTGYNGFPRGCYDSADDVKYPQEQAIEIKRAAVEARHERPLKYAWTEHAERNAIYNAARHGIKLEGATIYVPWFPCADCMRAIIQSGIKALVCEKPDFEHPRWGKDFKLGVEMASEAGLKMFEIELPTALPALQVGEGNAQPRVN